MALVSFPKSLDISKALDKMAGAEREIISTYRTSMAGPSHQPHGGGNFSDDNYQWKPYAHITAPATDAAKQWDGYGTALKPAWEPIILAMKPLDGTFAENALKWGVAGLWIDGGRVPTDGRDKRGNHSERPCNTATSYDLGSRYKLGKTTQGRFPANVIHDGSDEVVERFPEVSGNSLRKSKGDGSGVGLYGLSSKCNDFGYTNSGSAARFFYTAKASRAERGEGNKHCTVKPLALMRYLVKLTRTPSGGIVYDPFIGSGTTALAAIKEDRQWIGSEINEEYVEIANKRIKQEMAQLKLDLKE